MMDESNENNNLSFSSREDFYEETFETGEIYKRNCLATECVFARWSKPVNVRRLLFVSKNTLLIHAGKTLIFHNVKTQKEDVLVIGGNESTPSGSETLTLDGIGCVACCGTDLLALAEHPPASKVLVCRYPDLKVLATLVDSGNPATYKSISLLRLEYLIGLRDRPTFDLILWAWRVQEILLVVNTGYIQPNQSVYVWDAGHDVHVGQSERDATCRLQLWSLSVSCRTAHAERTAVELPGGGGADLDSGCWTPNGWFVFCDSSADVHRARPGNPVPETRVDGAAGKRRSRAAVCASKQGFVLHKFGRLTCFKDADGGLTKTWTVDVDHEILCMVAHETFIYGWSDKGVLLELTQNKTEILKVYGMNIKRFTFVKPADKAVATINAQNVLQVWCVSTGELKSELKLNGVATNLCSNPFYPYVAVSFENGKVELLAIDPEANSLKRISKMVLCDETLSAVDFFDDGKECVITSFPTGIFYHVNIGLGRRCSVKKVFHLGNKVLDATTVEKKKSLLLAVLYANPNATDAFGNAVVVFDTNFNAIFELKKTQFLYASICKWAASFDAPDVVNVALTVTSSKRVHLMAINIRTKAFKSEIVTSDHRRKNVKVRAEKNNCVTFSDDGSYGLYEFDEYGQWTKTVTVSCGHWQTGGLIAAQTDFDGRNVLTLSRRGNFTCTSFKETCEHARRLRQKDEQIVVMDNVETKGIGFENEPENTERITWMMIKKIDEENANRLKYSKQKNEIAKEFEQIKKELLTLLEANLNGPDDTKIDIEAFDLNVDNRVKFKEKCKIERDEYEAKVLDDINKFQTETKNIINEHWEPLFVKPKSIYCLKNIYIVKNYPAGGSDRKIVEYAGEVLNRRMTVKDQDGYASLSSADTSLSKNYLDLLDHETLVSESDHRQSNDRLMMGSISHRYVQDIVELRLNHPFHYKLETAKDEIILLQYVIYELQRSFNALFDNLFAEKQHLLDRLYAYNDRLRVIEVEFDLACKIEPTGFAPEDYDWNQHEQTEQLTYVEDHEVDAKPRRTSAGERTSSDQNDRDGRLWAVREFRRRAIMEMMDGVLEKRWEDELKRDVPKPQCMETKKPEEYVEEDIRAINEYEKLVVLRHNERNKYRHILEEEKTKIIGHITKSIEKFDQEVFDLFQTKIKYNAAINQERVKIIRLAKLLNDSDKRKKQIQLDGNKHLEIENDIEATVEKISNTEAIHGSLLDTIETQKQKLFVLSKRFRSEFPTKSKYEQALTAFNRTPKMQNITNYSTLLGYQFADTIMNPNDDELDRLCAEFVKYLENLKAYDDYRYVDDNKLNIDRKTWDKICHYRRLKIELDLRIDTCQKDAAEKTNLVNKLVRDKKHKETLIEQIKTRIAQLENENLHYGDDPEVQLVLKQGNLEVPLTGHVKDFVNTTLLPKNDIDEVNAEIKEEGKKKINILSKLLMFRNEHRFLKWDHKIIKEHELELYKYRYNYIMNMKMSENMIHYFKFKMKGVNIAEKAEQTIDKELQVLKFNYLKEKKDLQQRIDKMVDEIREVARENKKIDKNITQINVQFFDIKSKSDPSIIDQLKSINDTRMETAVERSKMLAKLKTLHKEVMALERELESLHNKTYPDLYIVSKNTCA